MVYGEKTMSQMLKDALVDAVALKEAAVKNAEAVLTEKYADKIKEAVESLLEQDEEEMDPSVDEFTDELEDQSELPPSEVMDEVPLAAADGEKLCPCPEEEEEIEIDFDELERQMDADDLESDEMLDREEVADELSDEEMSLEEDFQINEDELTKLVEELEVDLEGVPNGQQGANSAEKERDEEIAAARLADEKVKEENEMLKKEMEKLQETVDSLNESLAKLSDKEKSVRLENKKIKTYVVKMSEKLNEINLVNTKLFYKNRVLESGSLNTRQKKQIVEAISKTNTVEETKALYEALQSGVGQAVKETRPQSLSEAVKPRGSSQILGRQDQTKPDPARERMLRLAGITNNK
jgi:hypothetical protein